MRADWTHQTDAEVRAGTHRARRALRRAHPGWSEREVWDVAYFGAPAPLRKRIDQLIQEGKLQKVK